MGRFLSDWKAAKSAYKELSDPKEFKADLSGAIAKHEALGDQCVKAFEAASKLEEQRDQAIQKAEAQRDAKKAAASAARDKIVDATRATMEAIRKIFSNSTDWSTPIGPLAAKYDDLLKKYKAAQDVDARLDAEFETAKKAAGAKAAGFRAAADKLQAAYLKSKKDMTDQLNGYVAKAQKLGNRELVNALSSMVGKLNPPGGGMGGY